jgi:hypothetical protein
VADAPKANAYDFVNADALGGVLLNQGNELVSQGGARYRAVYLGGSSRMMTLKTLRRLAELVDGGASVIGLAPQDRPRSTMRKRPRRRSGSNWWRGSGQAAATPRWARAA